MDVPGAYRESLFDRIGLRWAEAREVLRLGWSLRRVLPEDVSTLRRVADDIGHWRRDRDAACAEDLDDHVQSIRVAMGWSWTGDAPIIPVSPYPLNVDEPAAAENQLVWAWLQRGVDRDV